MQVLRIDYLLMQLGTDQELEPMLQQIHVTGSRYLLKLFLGLQQCQLSLRRLRWLNAAADEVGQNDHHVFQNSQIPFEEELGVFNLFARCIQQS